MSVLNKHRFNKSLCIIYECIQSLIYPLLLMSNIWCHINFETFSFLLCLLVEMNVESSRSHLIVGIMIESRNLTNGSVSFGKLSLVDLAGSERAAKTGAKDDQLKVFLFCFVFNWFTMAPECIWTLHVSIYVHLRNLDSPYYDLSLLIHS